MRIEELLTSPAFDNAYEEYKNECQGISLSQCDTYYAPGQLEEKYKNSARWLVKKMFDKYSDEKVKEEGSWITKGMVPE